MSDYDSIMADAIASQMAEDRYYELSFRKAALNQCIYLFVEGESEEIAFYEILNNRLSYDLEKNGILIANYRGIGYLKHTLRLMQDTLSFDRPMVVTFDNDMDGKNPKKVPSQASLERNIHLFPIPESPVVTLNDGTTGGSFEESFTSDDFISACFNTAILKNNQSIRQQDFQAVFDSDKPYHPQMIKFLKGLGLNNYCPSKTEIAFYLARNCQTIPYTYIKLKQLLENLRLQYPISPI